MAETQLNLSQPERQYLAELLQSERKDTRVEEHRTRSPSYREHIVQREDVIRGLLAKLAEADVSAARADA
jgi:hypothetical protein